METVFVPILRFGFDGSNKSQYDLRITESYGQNILQSLILVRRAELVESLRSMATSIESGWLSRKN